MFVQYLFITNIANAELEDNHENIKIDFHDESVNFSFDINGKPFYYFFGKSKITYDEIDKNYNIYIEIPEITENYNEDVDFERETLIRMAYLFNKNTDFHFDKNKKTLKISFVNNRIANFHYETRDLRRCHRRHHDHAYICNKNILYSAYDILETLGVIGIDTSDNSIVFKNFVFVLSKIGVDDEEQYCVYRDLYKDYKTKNYDEFLSILKQIESETLSSKCILGKHNFDEFLFIILVKSIGYNYNFKKKFDYLCSVINNKCDIEQILKKYIIKDYEKNE